MKKKRANGEGSIFQRSDKRWVGKISLGYDVKSKRRIQKTVYGKTNREVREKLRAIQTQVEAGHIVQTKSQTFESFLKTWLEQVVQFSVRPSTFRSYYSITHNHLIPHLGKVKIEKLSPQLIQSFINEKASEGISAAHIYRVLRAALNQALKWDLIFRNPARFITVPKKAKKEMTPLTLPQIGILIEASKDTRYGILIESAIGTGLRLGELLGLRWSEVDLERGTLHVRHQLQRRKGKIELVPPKSSRSTRIIDLPEFLIAELTKHKQSQGWERQLSDHWAEDNFVFTTSVGTPLEPRNVRRALYDILESEDIPRIRFHDLRHTYATLLLAEGIDPRTMMETLGHSTVSLTMDIYAHVMPHLKKESAEKRTAVFQAQKPR